MSSVFATGLAGLQQAARGVEAVASNVANVNTPGYRAVRSDNSADGVRYRNAPPDRTPSDDELNTSDVELATEVINLKRHEQAYRANAVLIEAESRRIGTVLDIIA